MLLLSYLRIEYGDSSGVCHMYDGGGDTDNSRLVTITGAGAWSQSSLSGSTLSSTSHRRHIHTPVLLCLEYVNTNHRSQHYYEIWDEGSSMFDQAQEDEFLLDSLSESSGFHQTFYYHSCSVGI